jgi:hypothetical protein
MRPRRPRAAKAAKQAAKAAKEEAVKSTAAKGGREVGGGQEK